ncbi:MAG: Slp family lipoprotein [Burkholderiales bacterium]
MKLFLMFVTLVWTGVAVAGQVYTRDETLDQDLHGPRVEWAGKILLVLQDGDYTCFLLLRQQPAYSTYHDALDRFIACNPGIFEVGTYSPGRELMVTGNLGIAVPRLLGGKVYVYPVIAGAFLELLPYQHYLPQYNPFYYPPYYGPQFYHRRYYW